MPGRASPYHDASPVVVLLGRRRWSDGLGCRGDGLGAGAGGAVVVTGFTTGAGGGGAVVVVVGNDLAVRQVLDAGVGSGIDRRGGGRIAGWRPSARAK